MTTKYDTIIDAMQEHPGAVSGILELVKRMSRQRLPTYLPKNPLLNAEQDHITDFSVDTDLFRDCSPLMTDPPYVREPSPIQLTVNYSSGRYQVFVGCQAAELLEACEVYAAWLDADPKVPGPEPDLPEVLK